MLIKTAATRPRGHIIWKNKAAMVMLAMMVVAVGVVGAVKNLRSPTLLSSEADKRQDDSASSTTPQGLVFRHLMAAGDGGAAKWEWPQEQLLAIGANMNDPPQRKLTAEQLFPVGKLLYSTASSSMTTTSTTKNRTPGKKRRQAPKTVTSSKDNAATDGTDSVSRKLPLAVLAEAEFGGLEIFGDNDDTGDIEQLSIEGQNIEGPDIKICPDLNVFCGECLAAFTYTTTNVGPCFTYQICYPYYDFGTNGNCIGFDAFTDNCIYPPFYTIYTGTSGPACNARRNLGEQQDAEVWEQLEDDDELDGGNEDANTIIKALTSVLGFIRIPKTGSTTIVKNLDQTKHLYPWSMHLSKEPEQDDINNNKKPQQDKSSMNAHRPSAIANCIYGFAPSKKQLGNPAESFWNGCPHVTYGRIAEFFAKSLPSWSPPESVITDNSSAMLQEGQGLEAGKDPYTLSFNAFTIVRDPFDRLVSYFFYQRKFVDTNEFLKHTSSLAQYERVKANDLEGWMELLHKEDGGCGLELPFQYKYVHEDINQAIALIQNDATPQVYTLITECMEASLLLLSETFAGFETSSVEDFVKSDDFRSNSNSAVNKKDKPDKETLDKLRAKAEVWFADDFKFYNEAVEQFKIKLANSNMDASQLQTCKYWTEVEVETAADSASFA